MHPILRDDYQRRSGLWRSVALSETARFVLDRNRPDVDRIMNQAARAIWPSVAAMIDRQVENQKARNER